MEGAKYQFTSHTHIIHVLYSLMYSISMLLGHFAYIHKTRDATIEASIYWHMYQQQQNRASKVYRSPIKNISSVLGLTDVYLISMRGILGQHPNLVVPVAEAADIEQDNQSGYCTRFSFNCKVGKSCDKSALCIPTTMMW